MSHEAIEVLRGPGEEARRNMLQALGAPEAAFEELLAYNRNPYEAAVSSAVTGDEAFVADWERYLAESAHEGLAPVLRRCMVHLNFPVRAGLSQDPAWRQVALKGAPVAACPVAEPWQPEDPEGVQLRLQATPGGRIPVISVRHRPDFEALLQRILYRNEPREIPAAMGASMVAGYNNWERIARYKAGWLDENPGGAWDEEFSRLIPRKHLYQDRFIIVSHGPYSAVPAAALGLDEAEWLRDSLELRINHECGHYITKRRFGMMRNNLLDEILADTLGMLGAVGAFRADWFLNFMGLEQHPAATRPGGRIALYRGEPALSEPAFEFVKSLLVRATATLERRFGPAAASVPPASEVVDYFATQTLETLALGEAAGARA